MSMKYHLTLSVDNTILDDFKKHLPQINISNWCEEKMRMEVLDKLGKKREEDLPECEVCHQPALPENLKILYGHKVCKFCFLDANVKDLAELCKKPLLEPQK